MKSSFRGQCPYGIAMLLEEELKKLCHIYREIRYASLFT